jgi:hypothetical protein
MLLLQVLTFWVTLTSSYGLIYLYPNNSIAKHYCGSSLSGALFSACKKSGFVAHFSPRSEFNRKLMLVLYNSIQFVDNISHSHLHLISGSTRGIIDECCMNPCSNDQLIQYCQKKFARISISKKRCASCLKTNANATKLTIITIKKLSQEAISAFHRNQQGFKK